MGLWQIKAGLWPAGALRQAGTSIDFNDDLRLNVDRHTSHQIRLVLALTDCGDYLGVQPHGLGLWGLDAGDISIPGDCHFVDDDVVYVPAKYGPNFVGQVLRHHPGRDLNRFRRGTVCCGRRGRLGHARTGEAERSGKAVGSVGHIQPPK
jgi:hypothetical protein